MASELTSTTSSNVHLLVLIHGMWGNPIHLSEMERIYREVRGPSSAEEGEKGPAGEELAIIVPETNRDSATYDGIDWGGERVAEEVRDALNSMDGYVLADWSGDGLYY